MPGDAVTQPLGTPHTRWVLPAQLHYLPGARLTPLRPLFSSHFPSCLHACALPSPSLSLHTCPLYLPLLWLMCSHWTLRWRWSVLKQTFSCPHTCQAFSPFSPHFPLPLSLLFTRTGWFLCYTSPCTFLLTAFFPCLSPPHSSSYYPPVQFLEIWNVVWVYLPTDGRASPPTLSA